MRAEKKKGKEWSQLCEKRNFFTRQEIGAFLLLYCKWFCSVFCCSFRSLNPLSFHEKGSFQVGVCLRVGPFPSLMILCQPTPPSTTPSQKPKAEEGGWVCLCVTCFCWACEWLCQSCIGQGLWFQGPGLLNIWPFGETSECCSCICSVFDVNCGLGCLFALGWCVVAFRHLSSVINFVINCHMHIQRYPLGDYLTWGWAAIGYSYCCCSDFHFLFIVLLIFFAYNNQINVWEAKSIKAHMKLFPPHAARPLPLFPY